MSRREIDVNGQRLKMTPREFRLLAPLIENADRAFSHQQVLENFWGWEYIDGVDYIRIYLPFTPENRTRYLPAVVFPHRAWCWYSFHTVG